MYLFWKFNQSTRKLNKVQRVARPACVNATVHLHVLLNYWLYYCHLANDL